MSYYIDIIDTTSPLTKLVMENASSSGIVLKWNGSDNKDELAVVSSEFNFDMMTTTAQDLAFIGYFTGDENKYKVQLKNSDNDVIIWQGYILPDMYSEPYKNGVFFVSFTATDGLGRLKGKYLSAEFYSREKSLIAIYCEILKLTGIELDLYFNPAIENFSNKDWNTIYIDTATFLDKDKKMDAFAILEILLKDTLCVCYQCDNRWYIEGINTRHIRKVNYKIYGTDGVYKAALEYTRALKQITALPTPIISMIPPYNEITITHEKTEPELPETLSKAINDGWAVVTGVKPEINLKQWMANGGLYAKAFAPDYQAIVLSKSQIGTGTNATNYPQDDTQFVSLTEKIFYSKGQKVKFNFEFKIKKPGNSEANPTNILLWENPFKYELIFNNNVIFSNFGGIVTDSEALLFDTSGVAKIEIEHIILQDGLFDVKIYGPPGITNETRIAGIMILAAAVEVIGFKEEEIITDLINGEFTIDKEIELTYADDKSGTSKGFRLYPLKENSAFFNEYTFPILYGFVLNAKNYSVVQLDAAIVIKENLYAVHKDGVLIEVLNVHYNFNDGEQMVIETLIPYTTGNFTVKKYAVDAVLANRTNWLQWTDAIYKIENTSFAKTITNIYRRLFATAHEKLDLTAFNAVKFNDVVLFKYAYMKDFYPLNVSWNLDENKSDLTLARSIYKEGAAVTPGDQNIPPIVLAGDDIYLTDTQTTASLLATAYDPDGYIYFQQWTKTVGGFGDVISTPNDLATNLENLTEDFYTYSIQVTDNDGATATDTVNVLRIKDYAVTLDLIDEVIETFADYPSIWRRYKISVSPEILPGTVINFKGSAALLTYISSYLNGVDGGSSYQIFKNGASIETRYGQYPEYVDSIVLNYIAGDQIFIELSVNAVAGSPGSGDTATISAEFIIDQFTITAGNGTIIGLPLVSLTQTVSV